MTDASRVARAVGIAFGAFVIAWLVAVLLATWLFGSGNILVWVIAAVVGAGAYLEVMRRDRLDESRDADAVEES